jgi:Flp pilus assembly protein TadD
MQTGRVDEAIVQYRRALELKPNDGDARQYLNAAVERRQAGGAGTR